MTGEFPNTDRIAQLLREGKRAEAKAVREAQWDKAEQEVNAGKTICLSDLLAGDEAFVIDDIERRDHAARESMPEISDEDIQDLKGGDHGSG